jgi:nitroreductase/FMN reductase (NADPH)/FMN reductase [NAD(P)H]
MVVFGYPTQQQLERPKPERCPLSVLVHENTYRPMSSEEHSKLLRRNERKTVEETFQAFHKRKYDSDFAREMNRSVNQYVRDFSEQ